MEQLLNLASNLHPAGSRFLFNSNNIGTLSEEYISELFPKETLTVTDINSSSIVSTANSLTFSGLVALEGQSISTSVYLFDVDINNEKQRHCLLLLESSSFNLASFLSSYDTNNTGGQNVLAGPNATLSLTLKSGKVLFSSLSQMETYKEQLPTFVTNSPIPLQEIKVGLQCLVDLKYGNTLLPLFKELNPNLGNNISDLLAFVSVEGQLSLELSILLKGITTPTYGEFPILNLNHLDINWGLNYLSNNLPTVTFVGDLEVGDETIDFNAYLDITGEQLSIEVNNLPKFSAFATFIELDGNSLATMANSWPPTFSSVINDLDNFELKNLFIDFNLKDKTWSKANFTLSTDSFLELVEDVISISPTLNISASNQPNLTPNTSLVCDISGVWPITPKQGSGTFLSTNISLPDLNYSIEIPVGEGINLACLTEVFGKENINFLSALDSLQILDFDVEGNFKQKTLSAEIDTISDLDFTIAAIDFKIRGVDVQFDYANNKVQNITMSGKSEIGPVSLDLNGDYEIGNGWAISGGAYINNDITLDSWLSSLVVNNSDLQSITKDLPSNFSSINLVNIYFQYNEADASAVISTGLKQSIPIVNDFSISSFYGQLCLSDENKSLEVKALLEIANIDIDLDVKYNDDNNESGWLLSGTSDTNQDIEIDELYNFFNTTIGFSNTIPAFLKSISITNIGVQIDTSPSSKAFSFNLDIIDTNQTHNWLALNRLLFNTLDSANKISLQCDATVFGIDVDLDATENDSDYWIFKGSSKKGQKIELNNFLNHLIHQFGIQLPSGIPKVNLENLNLNFTPDQFFNFSGTSVSQVNLPLGDAQHKIDFTANVTLGRNTNGKSIFSGNLSGKLTVDANTFDISYEMGQDLQIIRGTWQANASEHLGIGDLLSVFGISFNPTLPNNLSIDLNAITFEYIVGSQTVIVAAKSTSGSEAFICANKTTQDWEIAAGLELKTFSFLSDIPVVGHDLKSASLLVSTAPVTNFTLPVLPTCAGVNGQAHVFSMDGNPVSLSKGISFMTVWDVSASGGSNAIVKNTHSLLGKDEVSVFVDISDRNNIAIKAELNGGISIPTGKSSDLKLENTSLSILIKDSVLTSELQGTMVIHIDGEFIDAVATLAINELEADVSIVVSSKQGLLSPALLKGVHIDDFGIEMGVYFEPPGFDMGLTGKLHIGKQAPKSDDYAFFLEIIEEVPNPLLLAFSANEISLGECVTAVTGNSPALNIPPILQQANLKNVDFYWCDDVVVLPDGTTAMPGFRFHGLLDIFGFDIYGQFQSNKMGIRGSGELDPVSLTLGGISLFSFNGDGKGFKIKEEQQANKEWVAVSYTQIKTSQKNQLPTRTTNIVAAGGPIFDINSSSSPFVHGSAHIQLLGLYSESILLTISDKGITFTYSESATKITGIELQATLTSTNGFSADGAFKFHLNGTVGPLIPDLSFTQIELDVDLEGQMMISIDQNDFSLQVDGNFNFEELALTIPQFTIKEPFSNIDDLADKIWKQIEAEASTIFKDVIDEATPLIKNAEKTILEIGKGAEEDVQMIAQETQVASQKIAQAAQVVAQNTEAAEQDVVTTAKNITADVTNIAASAADKVREVTQAADKEAKSVIADGDALVSSAEQTAKNISDAAQKAVAAIGADIVNVGKKAEQEVEQIGNEAEAAATTVINGAKHVAQELLNNAQASVHAIEQETNKVLADVQHLAEEAEEAAREAAQRAAAEAEAEARAIAARAAEATHKVSHFIHSLF